MFIVYEETMPFRALVETLKSRDEVYADVKKSIAIFGNEQ